MIATIAGHGMLAFRDPHGILAVHGQERDGTVMVASESVALEGVGVPFRPQRGAW